jgi:hypothetical protein
MQRDWRDEDFQRAVRRAVSRGVGLRELTAQTAEAAIQIALAQEDNNVRRAALKLRVTDRALQMRRAAGQRPGPAAGSSRDLPAQEFLPNSARVSELSQALAAERDAACSVPAELVA